MGDQVLAFVEIEDVRLCLSCFHAVSPSHKRCCPEPELVRIYRTVPKEIET